MSSKVILVSVSVEEREGEPITSLDLLQAVRASAREVYPHDGGGPFLTEIVAVVPTLEIVCVIVPDDDLSDNSIVEEGR